MSVPETLTRSATEPAAGAGPLVHAIVLNWNGWEDTLRCLSTLDAVEYGPCEIVVVDNGSTDGSEQEIRSRRPETTVIRLETNLGPAGGSNAGIRHALANGADYVWLLNNDMELEPSSLSELVRAAEADPRCGALTPRVLDDPGGEQWNSAFLLDRERRIPVRCAGCSQAEPYHPAEDLRGPSLFVRAATLREVGLLDERYFHYFDETDLMQRVRAAGWRLGLACRAAVTHEGGGTMSYLSPQSQYYLNRNRLLYRQRVTGQHPLRILAREPVLLRRAFSLRRALAGDLRPTIARVLGLADAVRGRTGRRNLFS